MKLNDSQHGVSLSLLEAIFEVSQLSCQANESMDDFHLRQFAFIWKKACLSNQVAERYMANVRLGELLRGLGMGTDFLQAEPEVLFRLGKAIATQAKRKTTADTDNPDIVSITITKNPEHRARRISS